MHHDAIIRSAHECRVERALDVSGTVSDMTCWESVGLLGPCALLASSDVRVSAIPKETILSKCSTSVD